MATSLMAVVDPGCIGHRCTYLFDVRTPGEPAVTAVTAVTHGPTCSTIRRYPWPVPPAGALADSLTRVTVEDGYLTPPKTDSDRLYEVELASLPTHQREGLLAGTWRIAADPRWPVLELVPGWRHLDDARKLWRELVRRARLAVEALRYGYEAD